MSKVNASTPRKGSYNPNKNDKKDYKTNNKQNKRPARPTFVKKQIPIAYSDFYANNIDSLYNILSQISFDKIAITVKMSRAELTGDSNAKGTIVVGTITKFNSDNTFTISMTEENAKAITDKSVMSVRCRKDRASDEITYISELSITEKYESINDHYKDIEEAFSDNKFSEIAGVDTTETTTEDNSAED